MTYPYTKNGYVDTGAPITASNRRTKCPNCGSSSYLESVSREECKSCGLVCDYWGGGTNDVYKRYEDRLHLQHEAEREEADRKWREENEW